MHPTYVFVLRNTSNILNMLLLIILFHISDKAFPIRTFFCSKRKTKRKKNQKQNKKKKKKKEKEKKNERYFSDDLLEIFFSPRFFHMCLFNPK